MRHLSQWFPTLSVSWFVFTFWLKSVDPLMKPINTVTYKWSLREKAVMRFGRQESWMFHGTYHATNWDCCITIEMLKNGIVCKKRYGRDATCIPLIKWINMWGFMWARSCVPCSLDSGVALNSLSFVNETTTAGSLVFRYFAFIVSKSMDTKNLSVDLRLGTTDSGRFGLVEYRIT